MEDKIINCTTIFDEIFNQIKPFIKNKKIAILYDSNDQNTLLYLRQITKLSEKLGVYIEYYKTEDNISKIIKQIEYLNIKKDIDGILLIKSNNMNIDYEKINKKIIKEKNLDNINHPNIVSAIEAILEYMNWSKNKQITIIGNGILVGRSLYKDLKGKGYLVNICDSKTKDEKEITTKADLIISAVGKANLIDDTFIKDNATIIDAGNTYINGKFYTDVNFNKVISKVKKITPLKKGVGYLTTIFLFKSLYEKTK